MASSSLSFRYDTSPSLQKGWFYLPPETVILGAKTNDMDKRKLWLRLKDYHFDHMVPASLWEQIQARFGARDASTKAFAYKVARKTGWSHAFALKAVHEYKKFVYLGVVSDFVVTPSQVIDQVWHQHILFSKAYRSFCQDVIRYDFDHNPELIAMDDQTGAFQAQYLDTLELYRTEFGVDPPADIWGAPKFDNRLVLSAAGYHSKRKEKAAAGVDVSYSDDPLYRSFDPVTDGSFYGFLGFGDGDGGGAGAGGDWGDGDSSDSGGDSSCSSCSSGCGGCGGD